MKFPVSCRELRVGSAERNTFVAVYKALLVTLVKSGSMAILQTISAAAADPDHACADQITADLQTFMKRSVLTRTTKYSSPFGTWVVAFFINKSILLFIFEGALLSH